VTESLPFFNGFIDNTNLPGPPPPPSHQCCTCTCRCTNNGGETSSLGRFIDDDEDYGEDDPLRTRPIYEVCRRMEGQPPPPPIPSRGRPKRDRSDSCERRAKEYEERRRMMTTTAATTNELLVSDLKMDGLRVSPPGSPGRFDLVQGRIQSPLPKKNKPGSVFWNSPSAVVGGRKKLSKEDLSASKGGKPKKSNKYDVSTSSMFPPITTTSSSEVPPPAPLAWSASVSSFSSSSVTTATTTTTTTTRTTATTNVKTSSSSPPKRIRRKVPEDKDYVVVHDLDVLFGRGGKTYAHHGNIVYRHRIRDFQPAYRRLSAMEDKQQSTEAKQRMCMEFFLRVKMRGGRFLELDKDDEQRRYYVVEEKTALSKISQALREDHSEEGRAAKKSKRGTRKVRFG